MAPKQSSKRKAQGAPGWRGPAIAAVGGILIGAVVAAAAFYFKLFGSRPLEVQPLRAKRLTDLDQFSPEYKNEMLWGSYRSGLYLGMRTRVPKSLLAGFMWFDPDSYQTLMHQRLRHYASQDDGLQRYGWVRHDGRTWGRQNIIDQGYNITLTMVKHQGPESGPGGDWAIRAHVSRVKDARDDGEAGYSKQKRKRISLVLYMTDEDKPKNAWSVLPHGEPDNLREGAQLLTGGNKVVGDWSLHVVEGGPIRKVGARLNYLAMTSMEGDRDFRLNVHGLMLSIIYEHLQRNPMGDEFHMELPNGAMVDSDLAIFQVTLTVGGVTDWVFLSHDGAPADDMVVSERVAALSGDALTQMIKDKEEQFDERFDKTFPSSAETSPEVQEVAKAALSNLLGSMGYFYGTSKVRVPGYKEPVPYWPAALFTAVPSRSFFPRGFLWDEGFHQLLVSKWDPEMSRDVLAHWLDLMNTNGWIPREQILGAEAEQRVPAEFVVQDPTHANPPSLFLPILSMAKELRAGSEGHEAVRQFLSTAWPRLETWYAWLNTSQAGPVPGSYRWRGRNATTRLELNPKTLTSGLDDYPRASHPSEDERHLDLRCWMALVSQAMASIATSLSLDEETIIKYSTTADLLSDTQLLDSLHWDESHQQYLDWGLHTEEVRLEPKSIRKPGQQTEEVYVRVVDEAPSLSYVRHFGYVSLFPLLMRLLPADSPRLGSLLSHMSDRSKMWTRHGLRSLSADSSLYKKYNTEHDPPYWRGQIWVNINYLALSGLKHYASVEGPYQQTAADLEQKLRQAVTTALVSEYHTRGYLYEQYDDKTGQGKSSHPFTGWTALITLIATGAY